MPNVVYTKRGRLGYIKLNRPEKRNALNFELISELSRAFDQAEIDDGVKVVILCGEGKAFCAGADLAYLQQLQSNSFEENLADSRQLKALFYKIHTFPKIVIAQVNGHAIAGGCGLVTVCDFAFAVPGALFGYTEVRIGFVPAIVMPFLIRKIGGGKAKELLLAGDTINAARAEEYGIVYEITEAEKLENRVKEFAEEICKKNSGESIQFTKDLFTRIQGKTLEQSLEDAAVINARARNNDDCKKGINAFLKREDLNW